MFAHEQELESRVRGQQKNKKVMSGRSGGGERKKAREINGGRTAGGKGRGGGWGGGGKGDRGFISVILPQVIVSWCK